MYYFAVFYLVNAYALLEGMPPFYKEMRPILSFRILTKDELLEHMHWAFVAFAVFGAAIGLFALTGFNWFLLILPAGCLYAGWSIRSWLKRTSGGPLPWVTVYTASPVLFPLFNRRPMLLFDIWTVGIASAIVLLSWTLALVNYFS